MSLTIKELQSIIQNNRAQLAVLYCHKAYYKRLKRTADEGGNTPTEYMCHNKLKELSKEIAKLVLLQKSLKAGVRELVRVDRYHREMLKAITVVNPRA